MESPKLTFESIAGESLVARVRCEFDDGRSEQFYATTISDHGAFLLAARPPKPRNGLLASISPVGLTPLEPIRARVTESRIDTKIIELNGFEITFEFDDASVDLKCDLASAVVQIQQCLRRKTGEYVAINLEPRKRSNLNGEYRLFAQKGTAKEMWRFEEITPQSALIVSSRVSTLDVSVGDTIQLCLEQGTLSEPLILNARVLRQNAAPSVDTWAIDLSQNDSAAASKLKTLITA